MKAQQKRNRFRKAAGILTIAASLFAIYMSAIFLNGLLLTWEFTHAPYYGWRVLGLSFYYYLAMGVLGVVSFFFGIVSGIFVWEKKRIKLSLFGLSLLTGFGVMIYSEIFIRGAWLNLGNILFISIFGLPILVPSLLSIIFVVKSKAEFNEKASEATV